MNQEVKTQWLEALRTKQITRKNGEVFKFNQGTGKLRRRDLGGVDKLCCLGVLTELGVEAGVLPPPEFSRYDECHYVNLDGFVETDVLPDQVVAWAGLDNPNPNINPRLAPDEWEAECLASLNDHDETFDVIADVIEAEF